MKRAIPDEPEDESDNEVEIIKIVKKARRDTFKTQNDPSAGPSIRPINRTRLRRSDKEPTFDITVNERSNRDAVLAELEELSRERDYLRAKYTASDESTISKHFTLSKTSAQRSSTKEGQLRRIERRIRKKERELFDIVNSS